MCKLSVAIEEQTNTCRVQNPDIPRAGPRFARRSHNLPALRPNCRRQVSWMFLRTDIQRAGFRLARRPLDLAFRPPSCRRLPPRTSLRRHNRVKPVGKRNRYQYQRLVTGWSAVCHRETWAPRCCRGWTETMLPYVSKNP